MIIEEPMPYQLIHRYENSPAAKMTLADLYRKDGLFDADYHAQCAGFTCARSMWLIVPTEEPCND